MPLFRDRYSTRSTGQLLLVLADAAASIAAFLFSTGLLAAPHRTTDALFLVLWVATPHCIATFIDTFLQQRDLLRSYLAAVSLALFVLALFSCGFALLVDGGGGYEVPGPGLLFLLLSTWISGFLLFLPRVYLFHDLFLFGLILLGIASGRPQAALWLPLFLVAVLMSAALRHQLHDVFAESRRVRLNLQNARVCVTLLAAVVAIPLWIAYDAVGLYQVPKKAPTEQALARSLNRSSSGEAQPQAAPFSQVAFEPSQEASGPRTIGLAPQVRLGSLRQPRYDTRAVLVARATDPDSGELVSLVGGVLWKALVFSTYEPAAETWVAETMSGGSTIDLAAPVTTPSPPIWTGPVHLDVHLFPVFSGLIMPYFPQTLQSVAVGGDAAPDVVHDAAAGLFLFSPPAPDLSYSLELRLDPGWWAVLPDHGGFGVHPDRRYLELPKAADLGWDLQALAARVFEGCEGVLDRVRAVEDFLLDSGFQYSDRAFWERSRGDQLRGFVEDEKVGNCEYFGTFTTLLMRAGGISARSVGGYAGAEWDPEEQLYVVRNSQAHLWTEIFVEGRGWYPFDATGIVPRSTESRAPGSRTGSETGPLSSRSSASENPRDRDGAGREDGATGELGAADQDDVLWDEDDPHAGRISDIERLIREANGTTERRPSADRGAPGPLGQRPLGASRHRLTSVGETGWVDGAVGTTPLRRHAAAGHGGSALPLEPGQAVRRGTGEFTATDRSSRERPQHVLSQLWRGGGLRWLMALGVTLAVVLLVFSSLRGRRDTQLEDELDADENDFVSGAAGTRLLPREFVPETHAEQVLLSYQNLHDDLAEVRKQRRPAETPVEHGKRLTATVSEGATRERLHELHDLVYNALYGARRSDRADAERARDLCQKLRSSLG